MDSLHRARLQAALVAKELEEALEARDIESESRWRGVVPARKEPTTLTRRHLGRVLSTPHLVGQLEKNPLVCTARLACPLAQRRSNCRAFSFQNRARNARSAAKHE
jgi:hypothetical protein